MRKTINICDNCSKDITQNKMWAMSLGTLWRGESYQRYTTDLEFCDDKCLSKWLENEISKLKKAR